MKVTFIDNGLGKEKGSEEPCQPERGEEDSRGGKKEGNSIGWTQTASRKGQNLML